MRVRFVVVVVCCGLGACSRKSPASSDISTSASAVAEASFRQAAHDITLRSETFVVSARVAAGATLDSILRAQNFAPMDIARLIERTASVFDPRKVKANQLYRLERALDGSFRKFEYEIDGDRFLRVSRLLPDKSAPGGPEAGPAAGNDAIEAKVLPIPKTRVVDHIAGQIRRGSSLVEAIDAAGETVDLTLAIAEILGGEIDFTTEVRPGDRFDVRVEKQFRDGSGGAGEAGRGALREFAGYGPVMAVEFVNAGRQVRALRFTPEGGEPGYYDERGISMKRFFLASPLKFQPVVTSAFSRSRFHPVLKAFRPHLGVDYRAPAGAPVVAVADGVVLSAGDAGGAGRLVHLRHANGFESEYLHLSSIAVHAGTHVRQGDLIGRVGSSGLATGPHLDYRLKKNGVFINPVAAHRAMPPGEPVPAQEMAAFATVRDQAFPVANHYSAADDPRGMSKDSRAAR